ncbi:MAG TPA: cation:proton antiporter, partial [Ktedonobacteraceae bacterium]|nr:cation:proton antiporter [Ktedonobacteraceae bacterium]
ILTPFAAYLLAETLNLSGVLAVVAAGLYLSRQSARIFSSNTRLQAYAVWEVLVFLLNGFVFLLVGLQLHSVLNTVGTRAPLTLIWDAALVCLTVIVARIAWVIVGTYLVRWLSRLLHFQEIFSTIRSALIVSWTGMRGGVSLAAALALPLTVTGGGSFPDRDLVIFLTFSVILVTLVVQGLSLSPLIRLLHLKEDGSREKEHTQAHLEAARAALMRLDELSTQDWVPEDYLNRMRSIYEKKIQTLGALVDGGDGATELLDGTHRADKRRLHQEILEAERSSIIQLRDRGRIDDEVLREVERELDLEEQRLQAD